MKKYSVLFVGFLCISVCAFAEDTANSPPQAYNPTYIYGETPGGVYMGDPYTLDDGIDDGMFMDNGETMHQYTTQGGQNEQYYQYVQGQEELMADHSRTQVNDYVSEQKIGNKLDNQYQSQIDAQTGAAPAQPIVLPSM
jgi:hypothetical protein